MKPKIFSSLDLQDALLTNLDSLGYKEMTPIQEKSIPAILSGSDVIGQAKTGSGKTAAFGLGLLEKLDVETFAVQSLVLCPTRELAEQVSKALRQLARTLPNIKILSLCGGAPFRPQGISLSHGAHIVVGTPGRVTKHLHSETLKLDALKFLVLDEGDRMLEMGFQEDLETIFEFSPSQRQTLLFSATFPEKIEDISKRFLKEPVKVKVDSTHDHHSIFQNYYKTPDGQDNRLTSLRLLLQEHQAISTVIFCTTKIETQALSHELYNLGYDALALHGDLEQIDRDEALVRFAQKSISILVATDVASRGLDIDGVDHVINFHISKNFDVHLHRIGRTGRAGSKGIASSLYTSKEESKFNALGIFLGQKLKTLPLPPKSILNGTKSEAPMISLKINSGKKHKLRAGNILGALTGEGGVSADQVGKIHINDQSSYVSIKRDTVKVALRKLKEEKYKGRSLQAWPL